MKSTIIGPHYTPGEEWQREFTHLKLPPAPPDFLSPVAFSVGIDSYFVRNFRFGVLGSNEAELTFDGTSGRFQDNVIRALNKVAGGPAAKELERYEEKVARWFATTEARGRMTELGVYRVINALRQKFFPAALADMESRIRTRLISQTSELLGALRCYLVPPADELIFLAAVTSDYSSSIYEHALGLPSACLRFRSYGEGAKGAIKISDWCDFDRARRERKCTVHVLGTVNSLAAELIAFGRRQIESLGPQATVYLAAKDQRVGKEAVLADVEALLNLDGFADLRAAQAAGSLKLISTGYNGPGLDFRYCGEDLRRALELCSTAKGLLSLSGEANCLAANEIEVEHYRFLLAHSLESQRITGRFWHRDEMESPEAIILRVPAGIKPYCRWGHKHIFWDQFQTARRSFEQRHAANLPAAYADVRRLMSENGTHFVEEVAPELLAGQGSACEHHAEYRRLKSCYQSFYEYLSMAREDTTLHKARELLGSGAKVVRSRSQLAGGMVLVNGVILNRAEWMSKVVRAEDFPKVTGGHAELISFARAFSVEPQALLAINGLYFCTPTLRDLYNEQRKARSKEERIKLSGFYLDAFKTDSPNSPDGEGWPLYNKGYVGVDEKGNLVFGRRCLGSGRLFLKPNESPSSAGNVCSGRETPILSWSEQMVVGTPKGKPFELFHDGKSRQITLTDAPDVVVFTPLVAPDMPPDYPDWVSKGRGPARDNGYSVEVGEGRVNLIVINNRIQAVIQDKVLQPSMGVVISLSQEKYQGLLKEHGAGLFHDPTKICFALDWPTGNTVPLWYLGGGTLLVADGKNLVATKDQAYCNLKQEGWFNLLSMQTQETQVQDWVRGPRTILGQTKEGRTVVFTFSGGRGGPYCGARLDEAVELIEAHLRDLGDTLNYAINLDGGSSSAMVIRDAVEKFLPLGQVTTGPDNVSPLVRDLSVVITFERTNPQRSRNKIDQLSLAVSQAPPSKIDYENHWIDTWGYR
jgi:hypothetical protein